MADVVKVFSSEIFCSRRTGGKEILSLSGWQTVSLSSFSIPPCGVPAERSYSLHQTRENGDAIYIRSGKTASNYDGKIRQSRAAVCCIRRISANRSYRVRHAVVSALLNSAHDVMRAAV